MSTRRISLIVLLLIGLLIAGVGGAVAYFSTLPERVSQHETLVLGQQMLAPGSEAAVRVVVRDSRDGTPLEDAQVAVLLGGATVYEGSTGPGGTADVRIQLPDVEGPQTLVFETRSALGTDQFERTVTLTRDYRILLTTDKPLYQPGQIIHMRALALSTFDRRAASGVPVELVVADGKGNKVFRDTLTTDAFGVTAVDFQLADAVNTGPYKITATISGGRSGTSTSTEKTVTVERYTLPRFDIGITTDRTWYAPGAPVQATLRADYFFGKPVADAAVRVSGFTFDFERQDVFTFEGTTDADGVLTFDFALPAFVAGSELDGGIGRFYLQADVTDPARQTESANASLPVADQPLQIAAVPEGGALIPGVENIIYVLTSYPDGTPAPTSLALTIGSQTLAAETGPFGLAEFAVTPAGIGAPVQVTARDSAGNSAGNQFFFEGADSAESLLLRPDRPLYRVGDTMTLDVLTSEPRGTVYLDIIRDDQTISTRAAAVASSRTTVAVDLSPDLYGTLTLHAYKIRADGNIIRDTRLVVVEQADTLDLSLTTGQESYRPGDSATLDIRVRDAAGSGRHAAVGLAVVDEAVFARAEQDPGFAKLYFLLEQELLQPKYELHGVSLPDLIGREAVADPPLQAAQEGAARASLAEAAPRDLSFSLQANSRDDNLRRIETRQETFFAGLATGTLWLLGVIATALAALSVYMLWRRDQLLRGLGLALLLGVGAAVLAVLMAALLNAPLFWRREGLAAALVGVPIVIALVSLLAGAVRRRDGWLGWLLLGLVLLAGAGALLAFIGDAYWRVMPEPPVGALLLLVIGLPLAWLLRSADYTLDRAVRPALAAFVLAVPLLAATFAGVIATGFIGYSGAMEEEFFVEEVMMAVERADSATGGAVPQSAESDADTTGAAGPRLRQFFPETMLWLPDAVTNPDGTLQVAIPVADSITTWRLTALASTQDGLLGSAVGSLRVFQPFFVDVTLPAALTVGDEVSVPVGVFNYLPDAQQVSVTLTEADWFTLLGPATQTLDIAGNDVSVVFFTVRVDRFGTFPFTVTAIGSALSDAIQRQVRVYPDGKQLTFTTSDRVSAESPARATVALPPDTIPGTQALTVKIYPGLASQVVEGLDSLLQMPYGCFEQTSSTTYPNVLVLDYLQTTDQLAPEVQFKAEEYINLGYQRLTTFEVGNQTGAFSLFGDPPPDPMLTAYGLQEFFDMSRVYNVDPALISRVGAWLLSIQAADGSWSSSEGFRESRLTTQVKPVPVTAYVVWGLADAGFGGEPGVQRGISYLLANAGSSADPYELALIANALVAFDVARGGSLSAETQATLDRLAGLARLDGDRASWDIVGDTVMGSYGDVGSIETTALATLAFVRSGYRADLAQAGLNSLIGSKDSFGNWFTTQTTILALKTFIEVAKRSAESVDATVTVTLNDGQTRTVRVTPDNFDVVQFVTFDDIRLGDNVIAVDVTGAGNLMYQVSGSYYLPWDKLADYPDVTAGQLVQVDVSYDRTTLQVNDTVQVDVAVRLVDEAVSAEWAIVDLGIPPGFTVNRDDLDALVAASDRASDPDATTFERYELTGRQVIVYLGNLTGKAPLTFSYQMTARYPLRAQTPASSAYDYYNPSVSGETPPLTLVVTP